MPKALSQCFPPALRMHTAPWNWWKRRTGRTIPAARRCSTIELAMKPLEGLLVLDFSQFLAGPSAALRLADLGARVIKIERPDGGDLCRRLYFSNLDLEGDSTLFHS